MSIERSIATYLFKKKNSILNWKRKYKQDTERKQAPREKDEKKFEKIVKECLNFGREVNGDKQCTLIEWGTVIAGPLIDSERGPMQNGHAHRDVVA